MHAQYPRYQNDVRTPAVNPQGSKPGVTFAAALLNSAKPCVEWLLLRIAVANPYNCVRFDR